MTASVSSSCEKHTLRFKLPDLQRESSFVQQVTEKMTKISEKYELGMPEISCTQVRCPPLEKAKQCRKIAPLTRKNARQCASSQPRLLKQLERYIQKNLQNSNCDGEAGLQVYREAFSCLIYNFQTYKTLLQTIKNEYEKALTARDEHIRSLEHMKKMLVSVKNDCDQKIQVVKNVENEELLALQRENIKLLKEKDTLVEEKKTVQYINERLQNEAEEEYARYRDEADARKMLLADLTDLQEHYAAAQQRETNLDSCGTDEGPAVVKLALKKCREDLSAATKQLNEMIANYSDVVPRRDFDIMEMRCNTVTKDYNEMQSKHESLVVAYQEFQESFVKISKLNRELETENEMLRRSATPRPDWLRCAEHIEGGIARWQQLSEGKTSDELVEVLLEEISGVKHGSGVGYFEGKGSGPDVPRYLHYNGPVKNRRLGKRDVSILIKDIWQEKIKCQSSETMEEFVASYFERRYSIPVLRAEWAYNLADACQRLAFNEHIGLFWGILCGQIQETVYSYQQQEATRLKNALLTKAAELGTDGELSLEAFWEVHRTHFPLKSEYDIEKLVDMGKHQLGAKYTNKNLQFEFLFKESEEGLYGLYIQELHQQARDEQDAYIQELLTEIGVKTDTMEISMADLRRAFAVVDPHIDQPVLGAYLQWTFNTDKDGLKTVGPMTASLVAARLQTGNIRRVGKRA